MRKLKVFVLLLLMLAGISVTAFASLPSEQMLIIGNKAYFYNDISSKQDEINRQIFNNPTAIYYKDGTNIKDVFTNNIVQESMLYYTCGSQITYYKGYNSTIYLYDTSGTYNSVTGTGSAFATVDMTVTKVTDNLSLATVKLTSVSGIPGAAYFKVYDVSRDIKGITDTISTSFVSNPTTVNIYVYKAGDTVTPIASGVVNMPAASDYTNNIARVISNISLTSSDILLPRTDLGEGNIVNGGYISSDDQYIYYSNTADGGKIYKRSLSGLDDYPICDDNAKYINVVRGWIYYSNYSDKGKIYKVSTDGSGKQKLSDDIGTYLNVVGDNVYYSNRTDKGRIYVLNSNGISQPLSTDEADYINISGSSTIFYRNVSDGGRLYKMNLDGSYRQLANMNSAKYINANISSMVYYATDDGKIYRYGDLYPLNLKLVTKDAKGNNSLPVDDLALNINVVGNTIYYKSVKDGGKLYKVGTNGGVGEKVADMAVDTISVYTSSGVDTVFFTSNGKLYQVMSPVATTDKNGVTTYKLVAAAVAKPKTTLKVSSVDNISVTVDDTDVGKTIDQIDLNKYIPTKVPAMMSDGTIRQIVVYWDMSKVTAKNGVYVYPGTLVGYGKTVSLTLSLSSTAVNPTYVNVINNIGKNDIVQTLDNSGLASGDTFKVYDSLTATKPLAQQVADSTGHVVIVGLDLNKNGGTIFVTVTKSGQAESKKITVPYGIEVPVAPAGIGLDLSGVTIRSIDPTTSLINPNVISNVQVTTTDPNSVPLTSLQYKTEKVNGDGSKNTVTDWTSLTADSSGKAYINVTLGAGGAQVTFKKTGTTSVPDSAPTNPIVIAPRGVAPAGVGFDEQSSTSYSGMDKIVVSGTTSLMEYSVDGGSNWSNCTLGSTVLDNQSPGAVVRIRTKASKLSLPSLETVQIKITNANGIYSINSIPNPSVPGSGTLVLDSPADVTWSVTDEDKSIGTPTTKATIVTNSSRQATITAVENGRVKVWATATDGTGLNGYVIITIGSQQITTVSSDDELAAALINPSINTIKLMPRVYNMNTYNLDTYGRDLNIIGQGNTSQIKIKSLDSNGNFITMGNQTTASINKLTLKNLVIDGNANNIAKVVYAIGGNLTIDGVTFSNIRNNGSICDGIYANNAVASIKNSNFDSTNALNHAIYVKNGLQAINIVGNNFIANSNNISGYQYAYYQESGTSTTITGNSFRGYNHYDSTKSVAIANSDSAIVIAAGIATIGGTSLSQPNSFVGNVIAVSAVDGSSINTVVANHNNIPTLSTAILNGMNSINQDVLYNSTLVSISAFASNNASAYGTILTNSKVGPAGPVSIQSSIAGNAYLVPSSIQPGSVDTLVELNNLVDNYSCTKVPNVIANVPTNIQAPRLEGTYSLIVANSTGTIISPKTTAVITVDATAPVYLGARVDNANPDTIILTYNETVTGSAISASDFVLGGANVGTKTIDFAALDSSDPTKTTVKLTLNDPLVYGDVVTISYNNLMGIKDLYGNYAAPFSNQQVVNNVRSLYPPIIYASSTNNDTIHPINLTFIDDPIWSGKTLTVKDGSTVLMPLQYSVSVDNNTGTGTITINAGVLSAGNHVITVSATGYNNATVNQVIIAPATVTGITSSVPNGYYVKDAVIQINVTYNGNVTVVGTPQLALNIGTNGTKANYVSGSGTNTLQFNYVVAAGDNSSDLDATSISLNSGKIQNAGTAIDANLTVPTGSATTSLATNKNIVVDTVAPSYVNTTTDTTGSSITINFSEDIVADAAKITIDTTGLGTYVALNTVGVVSVTNNSVVIVLNTPPAKGDAYNLEIAANAIKDSAGNALSSVTDLTAQF